ncbi:hypothetical protein [Campylobacter sp. MIT 21-1682]|uniref:hypothetical protein n=1 Tax=Campylobacter sp. MIT 21-1682 TaxID=2993734 RepID=UPI00224A70ED|nr:hypothetical protein [Campylobacter sp. MIT 21-1682]MCX2752005.1 hypothetical protein [Campylobacter sp. MIT 21-1682]
MDKELFKKNLKALDNKELKEKLKQIKKAKRYELRFGQDSLDINFKDKLTKSFLYSRGGGIESNAKFSPFDTRKISLAPNFIFLWLWQWNPLQSLITK